MVPHSPQLSVQFVSVMCFCFGVYNNTACLPAIISTCFGHIKYILSSRLFQQFVCYGINFSSSRISLNLALIHKPNSDKLLTFRGKTELRGHWENGETIRAVAECHCRHDMMNNVSTAAIFMLASNASP